MNLKKLTSKFKHESPSKPKSADLKKENELARLSEWVLKTAESIRKDIDGLQKDGLQGKSYTLSTSFIDFDQFTRQDLLALRPALETLHEVCREKNISIDLEGFDLLPRTRLATEGGFSLPAGSGDFAIYIDVRHKYNYYVNPFSDELKQVNPKNVPKP